MAALRLVARFVTLVFFKIAEPRVARILQFGIYVAMLLIGHYLLIHPPAAYVGVLGGIIVRIFGVCVLLGGLAGAIAVLPGIWWLERVGVTLIWTGLGIFCVVALALQISIVGCLIAVALGLSLGIRWMNIRRFQLAPREE